MSMLTDPARCRVMLVTLAEETPVNEVVETAFALEDKVGVDLGPVVVNGLYPVIHGLDADPSKAGVDAPVLAAAADFRARRQELQQGQVARLASALPLPQLHLPSLFTVDLVPSDIDLLAAALAGAIEGLPVRTEVA
jgi:hypothetical protein